MGGTQHGQLYERSGAFYVRYRTTEVIDGVPQRVQRSKFLAFKDDEYYSVKSKKLKLKRDEVMLEINKEQGAEPRTNEPPEAKDMRVADFWDNVYLPFIEKNKRPRTVRGYRKIWDTMLKAHFGETTLRGYSTGPGTNWITSLSPKYSRNTLQHIRAVGSAIFSHAIATEALGKGALTVNPWHGVVTLPSRKKLRQLLITLWARCKRFSTSSMTAPSSTPTPRRTATA